MQEAGGRQYKYNGTAAQQSINRRSVGSTVTLRLVFDYTYRYYVAQRHFLKHLITLMSASAGADKIWKDITGIGLKQDIPAVGLSGTYILPMTQTVTAI